MKTLVAIVITLSLIIVPSLTFAKKEKKGPQSEKAYEHANENASFKRGEDFEAGKGKQKHQNLEDEKQRKKEKKSKEAKFKDDESKPDENNSKGGNIKAKNNKSKKKND